MSEQAAWRDAFSTYARYASWSMKGTPEEIAKIMKAKRINRWILQSAARELLPLERVAKCLRVRIPIKNRDIAEHGRDSLECWVEVWKSDKRKRAFYGNLAQCASVWHDPVCASKITEGKRVELSDTLDGCQYYQLMVTRTFQHSNKDHLPELRKDFAEAKREVKAGRSWYLFKDDFGIVGSISGTEVNYSLENGFHLHDHNLYFFRDPVDPDEFRSAMLKRYSNAMEKRGRYVSGIYGLDVRATNDSVADYVSKWGVDSELAKYPTKQGQDGHYSAFQLLQLYTEGVSWAGPVFREYARTMKGTKQLVWSRHLRKILGAGREKTDPEHVEAFEEDAVHFAWLSLAQWRIILRHDKRGELLEVAALGSYADLVTYLRTLGIFLES